MGKNERGDEVAPDLEQLRGDIRGVIGEVRDTLYDLRTDVSETDSIADVLEAFALRVQERSGMALLLACDRDQRLPILQEREMWRIAQEAVTNTERHAQATQVQVTWRCTGDEAELVIADNGRGFPIGKAGRLDSYGILGMRERRLWDRSSPRGHLEGGEGDHSALLAGVRLTRGPLDRGPHPLHRHLEGPEAYHDPAGPKRPGQPNPTRSTIGVSIRLMLADDHRMLREGLRRSMTDQGFDVVGEARDGDEAVRMAEELQPDIILMDVTMPEMDGVEACRQIRSTLPEVKVVMLTMHADQDVLASAIRAGASGYLVKDCSTEQIASAVRMAVSGETVLSPQLAASMLNEVRKLDEGASDDTRVVTKREEEVLQLIADGCSTPEVAERLFISQKTVKNHLASIYQKLDARDRTQAVLQAVRMGIVHLD